MRKWRQATCRCTRCAHASAGSPVSPSRLPGGYRLPNDQMRHADSVSHIEHRNCSRGLAWTGFNHRRRRQPEIAVSSGGYALCQEPSSSIDERVFDPMHEPVVVRMVIRVGAYCCSASYEATTRRGARWRQACLTSFRMRSGGTRARLTRTPTKIEPLRHTAS